MLKRICEFFGRIFSLPIIAPFPPGVVADNSALFGLLGMWANLNNYAESIVAVTTAGTNTTLTPAQLLAGVTKLNAGASGGFTITLPSTSAIIAALGPTIPTNGTYAERVSIENNNVAQTGTVTAGDANTTLTGTMTVATNTCREFILTVLSQTTIALENIGTKAL